jgi:hypothetical protein
MTTASVYERLIRLFREHFEQLPDPRQGNNTIYQISDAVLAAFAVFFTQSPSFLAFQRQMERRKGRSNAQSLFQMEQIPSDPQIRNLLDPIEVSTLYPLFRDVYTELKQADQLDDFRVLDGKLLISLDGTRFFSSQKIQCPSCSHKTTTHETSGEETITYYHDVIIPVLVVPESSRVITLEPEFIVPQDGHDKQDCEQAAAKRWVERNASQFTAWEATLLGDDLYCTQPFCELALEQECSFILVCKPDSHSTLYEWVDFTGTEELTVRHWNGQFGEIHTYRYVQHVPLRRGDEALYVNWCELTIRHETEGHVLYRNAFVTNYSVTQETVEPLVQAGRARWKSENESHNVLKTKGYHIEHNFGHGKQHLASFLLTLNLLAFLLHTVLSLVSPKYLLLRKELATRETFFQDVRTLTRYHLFDGWENLLDFMITQLELVPYLDSS